MALGLIEIVKFVVSHVSFVDYFRARPFYGREEKFYVEIIGILRLKAKLYKETSRPTGLVGSKHFSFQSGGFNIGRLVVCGNVSISASKHLDKLSFLIEERIRVLY
jgi:hypothetical protein